MHCTALGRALLAFTDRSARDLPPETLTKLTAASLVDPDEIDAELARTRERGYALNVGESPDDVGSIAAPHQSASVVRLPTRRSTSLTIVGS